MTAVIWILAIIAPGGVTLEPRLVFDNYNDCMNIGRLRAPVGTSIECLPYEPRAKQR